MRQRCWDEFVCLAFGAAKGGGRADSAEASDSWLQPLSSSPLTYGARRLSGTLLGGRTSAQACGIVAPCSPAGQTSSASFGDSASCSVPALPARVERAPTPEPPPTLEPPSPHSHESSVCLSSPPSPSERIPSAGAHSVRCLLSRARPQLARLGSERSTFIVRLERVVARRGASEAG